VGIVLGPNQYGKAEIRLVHVAKDGGQHRLRDLTVDITLTGDMTAAHLTGDNSAVLPTDTQKNTVYAFAGEYGVDEIESFAARLARHFTASQASIATARVRIAEHAWEPVAGTGHSFAKRGEEIRTAEVTSDGTTVWAVSGLAGLVLLNSAGSEFHGYVKDTYTTLAETTDRILATEVNARWRHAASVPADGGDGWDYSFTEARRHLIEAFGQTHSKSLQQTLYAMGSRVLDRRPEVAEVRLALPNKHHYVVDLRPFGIQNQKNSGTVLQAGDRPYGLIEGTVTRDDAPPAGLAW
jgi:urate oxidase